MGFLHVVLGFIKLEQNTQGWLNHKEKEYMSHHSGDHSQEAGESLFRASEQVGGHHVIKPVSHSLVSHSLMIMTSTIGSELP